MESLPTPPNEDHLSKPHGPKRQHSNSKAVKAVHRTSKRASTHGHPGSPAQESPHSHSGAGADGRHKRVWKACERCRMKKTKCDGEFPCKRCKDDGLVCTAGTRKKIEYKQLPRGYAEVLENTQFALIATVHKLYAMVRSGQSWELGEPELNDRGQPVIHNIASKLGCIRPNSDMDLPVHSVFPEDEAGLAELARQLEEQQRETGGIPTGSSRHETESMCARTDRASSSELDHSDFEDYRKAAFSRHSGGQRSALAMSPQSLSYSDFDLASTTPSDGFPPPPPSHHQSPALPTSFTPWINRPTSMDFGNAAAQTFIANGSYLDMDMLNQGLLESNFGTIKPHVLSCPNPEVMMGMGDPMIYSGYDAESLRL
ncbi:hypothetical protein B0T25DRAFT_42361 [Lasiosphaeria hispida]|uniref:Zn(2)-C6 fungal-type domain-containing protein n=1 Tax=Lasiosphaeria hispida TaxID=260671 RepID=A0AAJ0HVN9_9PEZI|nr:hypothetical protein B0T25DRAFT_42361 [Lasiosphaeria hispida]